MKVWITKYALTDGIIEAEHVLGVAEDGKEYAFFVDENNQIKDLILGESKNKKLTYRGKVFLNISKEEQKIILNFAKKSKVATPHFENLNPNIIWIKPSLICTIQYMMKTRDGNMRQPVFKGLRLD